MQETLTGDLEDTLDCPNIKTMVVALESSIYCESVSFRDIYVFYEKTKNKKKRKLILNKMYLIYWFGYSNQPHSCDSANRKDCIEKHCLLGCYPNIPLV